MATPLPPAETPASAHTAGQPVPPVPTADTVQREARLRTRRSFLLAGLAGLVGLGSWRWLIGQPEDDGVSWPLRRVLEANGRLANAYFDPARLAPTFPGNAARKPRVNGTYGMKDRNFDPATWRLRVQGYAPGGNPPTEKEFSLADIQALPRVEMTTELKCIEGWNTVVTWAGARLADFLVRYPLATDPHPVAAGQPADQARYVSIRTPDGAYYVGLEMPSALHPQTLLCYEMNGRPLSLAHGAPLRLVTPLKYGIKHLKRIGTMAFVDQRPADFWAERGYDWHAGH